MSRTNPMIDRLQRFPLFSTCTRAEITRLAERVTEHRAPAGEVLAREGTPGYAFFVILEGTATVTIGDRAVATLGPGEFFGETALLDNEPRTATVVADTDIALAVSSVREFAEIVAFSPAFTERLLTGLARRFRTTTTASASPASA